MTKLNDYIDTTTIVVVDPTLYFWIAILNGMPRFYEGSGMKRLTHPRYSPNLVPNDISFIHKLKKWLVTELTKDELDLTQKFVEVIDKIPVSLFRKCSNEWLNRMQRWINESGNYFKWK